MAHIKTKHHKKNDYKIKNMKVHTRHMALLLDEPYVRWGSSSQGQFQECTPSSGATVGGGCKEWALTQLTGNETVWTAFRDFLITKALVCDSISRIPELGHNDTLSQWYPWQASFLCDLFNDGVPCGWNLLRSHAICPSFFTFSCPLSSI